MANLTNAASVSRNMIQAGAIALVVLIVGRVVWNYSYAIYKRVNPDPPPPPTYGFGILPQIDFPESEYDRPAEYALETPDGTLPNAGPQAKVYKVQTSQPNLLALDRAKQQAVQLGFNSEPVRLSDTFYRWAETSDTGSDNQFPSVLLTHIYQGTFEYTVNWTVDPAFLFQQVVPAAEVATENVRRYLGRIELVPEDMVEGTWNTHFMRWIGGDYAETVSFSEADFIRIDLYRKLLEDTYPLVTADPDFGVISVVVGGLADMSGIVKLNYQYFPLDYTNPQTYPLKTSTMAWEELQSGGGYIASSTSTAQKVVVRRVELAYFDAYEPQPYLQPVWVFRGDEGFVAYVPALLPLTQ